MRRSVKWVGAGILALGLGASVLVCVGTLWTRLPGEELTPSGIRQSNSLYVKMRDGVEIAVTAYLPADLQVGERIPVLMRTTRYWRAPQFGWAVRVLLALHQAKPDGCSRPAQPATALSAPSRTPATKAPAECTPALSMDGRTRLTTHRTPDSMSATPQPSNLRTARKG